MQIHLVIPLALSLLMAGCSSSPVAYKKPSGGRQVSTLALAAGGGAAAGNALNSEWGAPAGAVAGLLVGSAINKLSADEKARLSAESYEQGARDARVKAMNEIYRQQAIDRRSQTTDRASSKEEASEEVISYPSGVYQGIRMLPHEGEAPGPNNQVRRE